MDRHRRITADLRPANSIGKRLVHRYEPPYLQNTIHPFRELISGNHTVCYSLAIYLLNLFLAFLQPKFDPSIEQDEGMEDGSAGGLPTRKDEEFRPFIRRLPEFKFWYSSTRAIAIGFLCTWFTVFDVPVFWPVLVVYWLILFCLTSE